MWRVDHLKLDNWMVYRQFDKTFADKSIVGIIAEYWDGKDKSNRAGKSAIIEAIIYALIGDIRTKKETGLIHHGEKKMMVELGLINSSTGKKIVIKRGRDIKNTGIFEVEGASKKKESQQVVNDIIGMSPEELIFTINVKQGDITKFMDLKPASMTEKMMMYMRNEHWAEKEQNVLTDLKKAKKKLEALELKRSMLKDSLIDITQAKKDFKKLQDQIKSIRDKRAKIETKITKLEVESDKGKIKAYKRELDEVKTDISELQDKIENIHENTRRQKQFKQDIKNLKQTIKDTKPKQSRKEVNKVLAKCESEISQVKSFIEQSEERTGVCPILNQSCDRIEFDKKKVKEAKSQLVTIRETRADKTIQMMKIDDHLEAKDDLARAEKVYEPTDPTDKLGATEKRLKDKKATKIALKDKVARIGSGGLSEELQKLREKLQNMQNTEDELRQSIGSIKHSIKQHEQAKSELSEIKSKISKKRKQADDLRYIAYMFSKKGIPAQEIENAFGEIEDEVNYVLERLRQSFTVSFAPDRELGTWEPACLSCAKVFKKGARSKLCVVCDTPREKKRREEMTINIIEDGNTQEFGQDSGGGKVMVSLTVRIAITRLIQRDKESYLNVIFLDEPDSALDPANKRAFTDLVTKTLIREFKFEQVFWITHTREIQDSIPDVIMVKREQTHSTARWLN